MLFNYCLALRHLGRYTEANEVARHVAQTWGHRDGAADMHLFLAVEAAIAGDAAAAQEHLRRVVVREDNRHDQQLLALARTLSEFLSAGQERVSERRRNFAAFRRQLAPHFGAWCTLLSMRDIRRTFRRVGDAFQREGAGPSAWLWFKWNLHWQWSLLLLCPVVFAPEVQPFALTSALVGWFFLRRLAR